MGPINDIGLGLKTICCPQEKWELCSTEQSNPGDLFKETKEATYTGEIILSHIIIHDGFHLVSINMTILLKKRQENETKEEQGSGSPEVFL